MNDCEALWLGWSLLSRGVALGGIQDRGADVVSEYVWVCDVGVHANARRSQRVIVRQLDSEMHISIALNCQYKAGIPQVTLIVNSKSYVWIRLRLDLSDISQESLAKSVGHVDRYEGWWQL